MYMQLNVYVLASVTSIIGFDRKNATVAIRAYNHIMDALQQNAYSTKVIESDVVSAAITLAKFSLAFKTASETETIYGWIVP